MDNKTSFPRDSHKYAYGIGNKSPKSGIPLWESYTVYSVHPVNYRNTVYDYPIVEIDLFFYFKIVIP